MKRKGLILGLALGMGLMFGVSSPAGVEAKGYQYFDEPPFDTYRVSEGDSFFYIGRRYGVDYRELMRINSDVDPYNMQVGSSINLVDRGTQVADRVESAGVAYKGAPYQYGASPFTTSQFDCSSFIQRAFSEGAGVDLPRTTNQQVHQGTYVSQANLQKGDLVFFSLKGNGIDHVAIYIDEDTLLHATSSLGVDYTSFQLYWKNHYETARRVL